MKCDELHEHASWKPKAYGSSVVFPSQARLMPNDDGMLGDWAL